MQIKPSSHNINTMMESKIIFLKERPHVSIYWARITPKGLIGRSKMGLQKHSKVQLQTIQFLQDAKLNPATHCFCPQPLPFISDQTLVKTSCRHPLTYKRSKGSLQ